MTFPLQRPHKRQIIPFGLGQKKSRAAVQAPPPPPCLDKAMLVQRGGAYGLWLRAISLDQIVATISDQISYIWHAPSRVLGIFLGSCLQGVLRPGDEKMSMFETVKCLADVHCMQSLPDPQPYRI